MAKGKQAERLDASHAKGGASERNAQIPAFKKKKNNHNKKHNNDQRVSKAAEQGVLELEIEALEREIKALSANEPRSSERAKVADKKQKLEKVASKSSGSKKNSQRTSSPEAVKDTKGARDTKGAKDSKDTKSARNIANDKKCE